MSLGVQQGPVVLEHMLEGTVRIMYLKSSHN